MNSKMLAALTALALTTSLASSGCMTRSDDADEITDGQEEVANGTTERTGEADEACGGIGLGWSGCGWGGFGWSGCGFAGVPFLGFGWGALGAWGGFGCGGFGIGLGLACGGFGGCGGCW